MREAETGANGTARDGRTRRQRVARSRSNGSVLPPPVVEARRALSVGSGRVVAMLVRRGRSRATRRSRTPTT